jgi:outer membrane protein OmpA-like peptidoglycan-associated protein
VNTTTDPLEWILRAPSAESGIDRKALAGLLIEVARNVEPGLCDDLHGVSPIDPRLEQLRFLLLGREIQELARLGRLVEEPEQLAAAVARILPAAIARASKGDVPLGEVLAPSVETATQTSIRNNPRTYINILYPLIIPAVQKSIGETIAATFQSLNESLKYSLTWRGLKWRFEAWRTGASFAEVVLKHTLIYQVEHLFLIHRHTGLLIAHAAAENAASGDPQLVSSMLAAIQDFVRDSFKDTEQQGLDALQLGELRLWSEDGPFAMLVAVIRGNPPEELHDVLRNLLAKIHAECPHALEFFDGDSSGFADVEAQLRACAALQRQTRKYKEPGFPWLITLAGLAILSLIGVWSYRWWLSERRWEDYVSELRAQPGIVVTDWGREGGKFEVAGLRDPLAVDPMLLLPAAHIDPAAVTAHWQTYQSLHPNFVTQRLKASLDPPATVTLGVEDDKIVARGSAPSTWIERARAAGRLLPAGGPSFDVSAVRDINEEAIGKLREAIQSREIHFSYNDSLPAPGQDAVLDELASQLQELAALSSRLHIMARVTLTGHSDSTGRGTFNISLSLARAEAVRALLKKRGVDPDLLAVRGAGPLEPLKAEDSETARSINRRVSFTVGIE